MLAHATPRKRQHADRGAGHGRSAGHHEKPLGIEEPEKKLLPMLQWHASALAGQREAAQLATIRKYAERMQGMGAADLHRHAAHVASWVALADLGERSLAAASQLLASVLQHKAMKVHVRKSLPPRLAFSLQLVHDRAEACVGDGGGGPQTDWHCLRGLLSGFAGKDGGTPSEGHRAALESHHRAFCMWTAAACDDGGEGWVCDLETKLPAALASGDARGLHAILEAAVVALSPPRAKALRGSSSAPLDLTASERLERGVQKRLRAVVLRILEGSHADVEDPRALPLLQRLRCLAGELANLERAACGRQWARLRACLEGGAEGEWGPAPSSDPAARVPQPGAPPGGSDPGTPEPPKVLRVNPRILGLPGVERIEPPAQVACKACGYRALSAWGLRRNGGMKAFVPNHGHTDCAVAPSSSSGRQFRCVSEGGATIQDHIKNVLLCEHGKQTRCCAACAPQSYCEHGKERRRCKRCRSKGLVATRK